MISFIESYTAERLCLGRDRFLIAIRNTRLRSERDRAFYVPGAFNERFDRFSEIYLSDSYNNYRSRIYHFRDANERTDSLKRLKLRMTSARVYDARSPLIHVYQSITTSETALRRSHTKRKRRFLNPKSLITSFHLE